MDTMMLVVKMHWLCAVLSAARKQKEVKDNPVKAQRELEAIKKEIARMPRA